MPFTDTGGLARAQSLDAIDSYGVYIEGEGGPVKLRAYRERYFELAELKEIPHVQRADKSVTLYVYQPEFDPDLVALEARYIAPVGGTDELSVDVAPTERDNLYRISTVNPVPDNRVLFFCSGWLECSDAGRAPGAAGGVVIGRDPARSCSASYS